MAIDKNNKTLETVTDKNGQQTRRWKGRKKAEPSENTDKLKGVKAQASIETPRNAAEARPDHKANSEPHVAGDGLSDDFKPFMDTENIFMARDGSEFVGEMNVVLDDDEDPAEVAGGFAERYSLDRSTRLVPSEYEGEGVLQFRGNIKAVSNMVGEYTEETASSVEGTIRHKYGVDDLDRDRFSMSQRRRARTAAANLADKHAELKKAQEEYDKAFEKLSEFGEGSYMLKDGRNVTVEQGYRFSSDEFADRYPQEDNPDMYEMRPKSASSLKKMIPKDDYESLRTPTSKLGVKVFASEG